MSGGNQGGGRAQSGMQGAAAGAQAGSTFGPKGAAIGAIVGGVGGALLGGDGSESDKAAEALRQAQQNALATQISARNQARGDLRPFVAPGTVAISPLLNAVLGQGFGDQFYDQQLAENQQLQVQKAENDAKRDKLQAEFDQFKATTSGGRKSQIKQANMRQAIAEIPDIHVPFIGDRPSSLPPIELTSTSQEGILNNPFFSALAQEQDQRLLNQSAALGKTGSGGTNDSLRRQQLLLGNQFQQQAFNNRQSEIANIFGLLTGGQNAAAGQANITTGTTPGIVQSQTGLGNIEAARLNAQAAQSQERVNAFTEALGALSAGRGGGLGQGNQPVIGSFSQAPTNTFQQGGAFQNTGNFLGGSGGIFGPQGSFGGGR